MPVVLPIPCTGVSSPPMRGSFFDDLLFQDWSDTPTRSRDGRLETKAADDLFEDGVALRLRRQLRGDFDAPALLEVSAIEPPQAELAVACALQEQGADMRLFRGSADHPNPVVKVGFGLRDRLPVDDPNQRPQCQIDENDESRCQCRMPRMAASRQQPHGCRAPQRGRGVEAGDVKSFAEDDSRTEKADPGDDLGSQPWRPTITPKQPSTTPHLA